MQSEKKNQQYVSGFFTFRGVWMWALTRGKRDKWGLYLRHCISVISRLFTPWSIQPVIPTSEQDGSNEMTV